MQALQAACHELTGDYNRLPEMLHVFEHKMQYILIHAACTRIVVFWQISDIPQGFCSQISYNTPCFV